MEKIRVDEMQIYLQMYNSRAISRATFLEKVGLSIDTEEAREKIEVEKYSQGKNIDICGAPDILKFKKLNKDAIIPKYQTEGASGFDFHALVERNDDLTRKVIVYPKDQVIVRTGLACSIPNGYEIQVRPKSGLSFKHKLTITNTPGTIDCVPKGTKIRTPAGDINVEDIYGIKEASVYSFNEEKKEIEEDMVKDMWIVKNMKLLEIKTEEGSIKIPLEKEIYTEKGWKKAKNLTREDKILSFN